MTIERTSPRTTKLLHQCGHFARFGHIVRIRHQRCCLCRKPGAPPFACRGLGDGLPRGLGSRHSAPTRQLVESTHAFIAEPERNRRRSRRHSAIVAQSALPETNATGRDDRVLVLEHSVTLGQASFVPPEAAATGDLCIRAPGVADSTGRAAACPRVIQTVLRPPVHWPRSLKPRASFAICTSERADAALPQIVHSPSVVVVVGQVAMLSRSVEPAPVRLLRHGSLLAVVFVVPSSLGSGCRVRSRHGDRCCARAHDLRNRFRGARGGYFGARLASSIAVVP